MTENTAPDEGATADPYEVVRARSRTGAHVSVTRVVAEDREYTILEGRPALDGRGRPLPGKPKSALTPLDVKGPFDPSSATVDGVLSELDKADPAEATRILAAEAAGKNRSKIASWTPVTTPEV